jgi:chromosome segregation ATPase
MDEPTTVTYSIAEILKRIEDKLDKIDEKFEDKLDKIDEKFENKLESNQKETNEKFKELNNKVETIQKDVSDLKVSVATLTEKTNGMDKRLEKVEMSKKLC